MTEDILMQLFRVVGPPGAWLGIVYLAWKFAIHPAVKERTARLDTLAAAAQERQDKLSAAAQARDDRRETLTLEGQRVMAAAVSGLGALVEQQRDATTMQNEALRGIVSTVDAIADKLHSPKEG